MPLGNTLNPVLVSAFGSYSESYSSTMMSASESAIEDMNNDLATSSSSSSSSWALPLGAALILAAGLLNR